MKTFYVLILSIVLLKFNSGCYKEQEYNQPFNQASVSMSIVKDTILADSFSTTIVTVELPSETDTALSSITFQTTAGMFIESDAKTVTIKAKKLDGKISRVAQATLRSSLNIEIAVVSINFFDNTRSDTVYFINAFPQSLQLIPTTFSIQPLNGTTGEIGIEAQALRSSGLPSIGNVIELKAYNSTYTFQLGSFRVFNNRTDQKGKANFVFVLGDSVSNQMSSPYIGRLNLIGRTLNENGQYISDTIQLVSSK